MAKNPNPTHLYTPDPWSTVAEAREQRGPIVAAWLIAVIALVCSWQFWPRTPGRGPGVPSHPETLGAGLSSAPGPSA